MRASLQETPRDTSPFSTPSGDPLTNSTTAVAVVALDHSDARLRVAWASSGFLELTHLRPEDALGLPVAALFESEHDEASLERLLGELEQPRTLTVTLRHAHRGDSPRQLFLDCVPLHGDAAKGSALLLTLRDGKGLERQLARRHRMNSANRVVRQHVRAGTWTIEQDSGDLVRCSEELLEILDVTSAELDQNPGILVSRIHPDDREWVYNKVRDALAEDAHLELEHRIQLPDGSTRWLQLTLFVYPIASAPCRAIGCVFDVTERGLANESASVSEQRFRAAAEASLDGLVLLRSVRDAAGRIEDFEVTDFNDQALEMLTDRSTELTGRRICDLLPRVRTAGYLPHLIGVVERAVPYQELIMNQSDALKLRWAQVQAVRLGDGLAVSIRDVSHQKSVEEQLVHANRLESVGRLAAGIAHDFNNMLSVVLSFDTLAYESLPPNAPERLDLAESLAATKRAAELTRRLLAFSRRQLLEPQVVEINALLDGLRPIIMALVGKQVRLVINLASGLPGLWIDLGQLEQAIVNLVTNAHDAMPHGGMLRIETSLAAPLNNCDASFESDDAYVQLWISDTGTGMTDAVREHIFEPFFTTKADRGGTGLGLASVFGFVKQSQGHISVDSTVGHGTTFRLLFRVAKEKHRSSRPSLGTAPLPDVGSRATVLLIDQDRASLVAFRRILEARAYSVLTASNADDALSLARHHEGSILAVLADATLQCVAGAANLSRLRYARPGIGLVFTSGSLDTRNAPDALMELGAVFLAKPVTPEYLFAKLEESMSLATLLRTKPSGGHSRQVPELSEPPDDAAPDSCVRDAAGPNQEG